MNKYEPNKKRMQLLANMLLNKIEVCTTKEAVRKTIEENVKNIYKYGVEEGIKEGMTRLKP